MLGLSFSVQAQNYQLIWADEFDGVTINLNNWTHEIGTGSSGWGNNELQYYTTTSNNSFVSNGSLKINAINQAFGQSDYTSARIITKDKFSFQYGKVEARIKMPEGQGLWPAFWMLGQNINSAGWPGCGEIDIVEHVNSNPDINGTMHWDNGGHVSWGGSTSCDVSAFHDYALIWDADGIHWLLDGIEYHSGDISNNINGTEEFHQNFFLILNVAVGGNWPGSPNLSTVFPATMEVDYIRVYQIGQAQSNVTFQVDMSDVTSAFTTPEVNGTFNNWCGNCAQMSDLDGDQIWTKTILLPPGNYEYKYSYDTWTGQENLTTGTLCTQTTGQFTNRTLTVSTDTILNPVCWESCEACPQNEVAELPGLSDNNLISIYPNPSNGLFHIDLNSSLPTSIEVIDLSGKKVKQVNVCSNRIELNLKDLTEGIYLLRILSEQVNVNHKIILTQ